MHGILETEGEQWILRFERQLPSDPQRVWQAVTDADELTRWYPTSIEGDRVAGAPLRMVFEGDDGPPLSGEVIRFEAPKVFEFSEGENLLGFTVEPAASGSLLRFVHRFGKGASAARTATGWHICLDQLQAHLAGQSLGVSQDARWAELHPEYVKRFVEEGSA